MKSAVQTALQKIDIQLESIKESVKENAVEVAENTIKHLHDISPNLAAGLIPKFKVEPKWENIFKLTLEDDRGIAINKRGSGVRRLVLISFLKRKKKDCKKNSQIKELFMQLKNLKHLNTHLIKDFLLMHFKN